jgi:hypothetical protein
MYLIVNKLCPLSLSLLLPVLTGGTVASQITNLSTKQWACKSFALRHPLFLLPSCLPTFSHFVSVNKTSLSLSPSLSQLPAGCSLNPAAKCCRQPGSRLPSGANVEVPPRSLPQSLGELELGKSLDCNSSTSRVPQRLKHIKSPLYQFRSPGVAPLQDVCVS